MNHKRLFAYPLKVTSMGSEVRGTRLEDLHERPFSESATVEDALLVMISKVIQLTRLLSKGVLGSEAPVLKACAILAEEVHRHEKEFTRDLLFLKPSTSLHRDIIRLPLRLERIGDMLERILHCWRRKSGEDIPFSNQAVRELNQLFPLLLDMMNDVRDIFAMTNEILVEHVILQGEKMKRLVEDFRSAHWNRLEQGECAPDASSIYVEILDSIGSMNGYLREICLSVLDMVAADRPPTIQR